MVHHNPVCCVQAPKSDGDPVMRAELQLLEKLIMGIREPPSSGEWWSLALYIVAMVLAQCTCMEYNNVLLYFRGQFQAPVVP